MYELRGDAVYRDGVQCGPSESMIVAYEWDYARALAEKREELEGFWGAIGEHIQRVVLEDL